MNRREALRLGAALLGGAWLGKLLPAAPELESARVVEAADMARMEATAIRQQYPRVWPLLFYSGAIQFSGDTVAFYGVGPPCAADADRQQLVDWLGDSVLDVGVSDCGRGWCVLSRGILSKGCRREQHNAAGQREHGQRLLEIHVRREEHRRRLAQRFTARPVEGPGE